MTESALGFEAHLRLSPRPVFAALLIVGIPLLPGSQVAPGGVADRAVWLFLLTFSLAVAGWFLAGWKPTFGRWYAVAVLAALVGCASLWLQMPGLLALAAIPAALAIPLLGIPVATATSVLESALLIGLLVRPLPGIDTPAVFAALVATWAILGVVYVTHRSARGLCIWLETYYGSARRYMEEAQLRRAELEQAMESLAYANRQLALANERSAALRKIAEEAEKAKTMFVANVSHEFRTPLNMIIGLVELMIEAPQIYAVTLPSKMREDLMVVQRNCEHLSNMINDVLDLTRIEAGYITLHRERVNLSSLIERAATAVRPLLEKKRLSLEVAVAGNLPEVYCDPVRVQQVVLNLLSNAVRFTDVGSISVSAVEQGHDVLVSVADTGPGVSPQDAERIFEPFVQGSQDLWRSKGGNGLGLSISKRFVGLHDGRMWLDSRLGAGTTFFFTLPLSGPIELARSPGAWIREDWGWREPAFVASRSVAREQLTMPRVVICDEGKELGAELAHYGDGIELVEVGNLAQATQSLQACPAHVLLLNTHDGDDLCAAVERARAAAPGTPVIGCSLPCSSLRTLRAGALGHLTKPVTRTTLEEAMRAAGRPIEQVLVVDDDPDARQLFSRMLHVCDSALTVITAGSGKEALDVLRRVTPDLMLLDIMMPEMDGWQLLECLEQEGRKGQVPTFLVSAQDPADQPSVSRVLVTAMDQGIAVSKLLRCALALSEVLLKPEAAPDPVSG